VHAGRQTTGEVLADPLLDRLDEGVLGQVVAGAAAWAG